MMASTTFHTFMTVIMLFVRAVVMQNNTVVIKVIPDPTSTDPYHIAFEGPLFAQLHKCMCMGYTSCDVSYDLSKCPYGCIAQSVSSSVDAQDGYDQYYKCTIVQSNSSMKCQTQVIGSGTPDVEPETYRIRNLYPELCVGLVRTLNEEGIIFNNNQQYVEYCGADCTCKDRTTTTQPETSPSPPSPSSPTETTAAFFPPISSQTSATTPQTSSTNTPTIVTTNVSSTASTSFPSTESSSGTESFGDDPPIGIIVGAVVGVIAVTVIIIILVVCWRKRRSKVKSPANADQGTSNVAKVQGKTNDGTSNLYYDTEFSGNNSESHTPEDGIIKMTCYQNSLHQHSITKDSVTPLKDLPKSQFAIKDDDSDFGYSKAQLVVSEDNNNTKGKKTQDNYDYVYAEDDVKVPDPDPKTTMNKTTAVIPPKVKYDYAVIDKTGNNKNPRNDVTDTDLTNNHYFILEEDYGYSRAEGDAAAKGTNDAAVGKAHATIPTDTLPGTSDQDFGYEYAQASNEYTTVRDVNQPNPSNDDPNTKNVYSRLHEEVRDIQNPYNVGPNTNDVYSKLHEEVRDIKNPYNVLPESQGDEDSINALPYAANNANDTKEQKIP